MGKRNQDPGKKKGENNKKNLKALFHKILQNTIVTLYDLKSQSLTNTFHCVRVLFRCGKAKLPKFSEK